MKTTLPLAISAVVLVALSDFCAAANSVAPTPIVHIRLMNSGQQGTPVQCPVQYSTSNPPHWFIKASASLSGVKKSAPTISNDEKIPYRVQFRYMFKVNGYPPPGHTPGIWAPSPGVSFSPPAPGVYQFEVFAQAWHREKAVSRVASAVIRCTVR